MLCWGHAVHAEGSVTFITTSGMTIDVKPKPSALHIVRQDSVLLRRPAAIIGGFFISFFLKLFVFAVGLPFDWSTKQTITCRVGGAEESECISVIGFH